MTHRQIIVASNRGPVSFSRGESAEPVVRRGVGGLVTALMGALRLCGGLWIASAMSDEDRHRAAGRRLDVDLDDHAYGVRLLDIEPQTFDRYYNQISNRLLWFLHHQLWDIPTTPRFGHDTREAWASYRAVNQAFASALEEEGSGMPSAPAYLVQDYHLALVPALFRERRPDALIAHFSHTPFTGPGYFRILPSDLRRELLTGLLGADVLGFQCARWAENFLLCCRSLDDARVNLNRRTIRWKGREVLVRVNPISIDARGLKEQARSEAVAKATRWVRRLRGDARLVLRVDRGEPSKNIVRGFLAYETFLRLHPEWRRRAKFLALVNPSRMDLPEYRAYIDRCVFEVERLNVEFGEPGWKPVEFSLQDDFALASAAYGLYDVLMVNPVFDGMNLVAKEGPTLNRRRGVLILSENAGAHDELGRYALTVNPFDVGAMADAVATALEMEPRERERRARGLKRAVDRNPLPRWVESQLADLDRV